MFGCMRHHGFQEAVILESLGSRRPSNSPRAGREGDGFTESEEAGKPLMPPLHGRAKANPSLTVQKAAGVGKARCRP